MGDRKAFVPRSPAGPQSLSNFPIVNLNDTYFISS